MLDEDNVVCFVVGVIVVWCQYCMNGCVCALRVRMRLRASTTACSLRLRVRA